MIYFKNNYKLYCLLFIIPIIFCLFIYFLLFRQKKNIETFDSDDDKKISELIKKSKKFYLLDFKNIEKINNKEKKKTDNIYEELDMNMEQLNDMVELYDKTIKN